MSDHNLRCYERRAHEEAEAAEAANCPEAAYAHRSLFFQYKAQLAAETQQQPPVRRVGYDAAAEPDHVSRH
jgi:hypothetical protein